MITKVAFMGHPTRDLEAARAFYGEVLGLERSADYGVHWSEFSTPDGVTIALDTIAPELSAPPVPYLALETDDIEAEVARLTEAGAKIAREPWANTGADGREVCKMAIVLDPNGNPVMLHELAAWRQ
jgi:predicted enzyme related to lactoylglutathione lyase